VKTTTTIMAGHLDRLASVEKLESEVYAAAARWAPAGQAAAEAKGRILAAQNRLNIAHADFSRILSEVTERDVQAGTELARLHLSHRLTRANVGAGGGKIIDELLAAEKTLREAEDAVEAATRTLSAASATASTKWRAVLQAADAFRATASAEAYSALVRSLEIGTASPNAHAAEIAERCKDFM
jgi:hypothetical protein